MSRQKILFGNWKMNHLLKDAKEFTKNIAPAVKLAKEKNITVGVAPSFLCLSEVKKADTGLIVAAQDVHFADHGAYTGFVSIPMLQEIGINWSILGHSERRLYADETSLNCNRKVHSCVAKGMHVIYCVGETLTQFESGLTQAIVKEQLTIGLMDLTAEQLKNVVIAYEPVWSIGTGKNASEEIAENVCKYIRNLIKVEFGEKAAEEIQILYGGSVKPENIHNYMTCPDIDGALVGGASLKPESFIELVKNM